jgi:pimeloyl-ACP methyl ester carboxylesterase
MTTATQTRSPRVRGISLEAGGTRLSGLMSEPDRALPRATVVALHGGGTGAGYFDGQAAPDLSLLELGSASGYTVLSLDRPGYGGSKEQFPEGLALAEQSPALYAAIEDFASRHETGAGLFLLAHSFGGKLALTAAANRSEDIAGMQLLGLDVSGCGHRYAMPLEELPGPHGNGGTKRNWGPLRHYPPGTFAGAVPFMVPMPAREREEAAHWPNVFPEIASRIRVPIRFTFAEHEAWWRHDESAIRELTSLLNTSRVLVDRQPGSGHNISLGWAARSYHLRALGFLEECLAARGAFPARSAR